MSHTKKIIKSYSKFVSKFPFIVLVIVLLISGIMINYAGQVTVESSDNKDVLPDNYPVIETYDKLEDNFNSTDSATIVIELDPKTPNSNEPRDVSSPEVLNYMNLLAEYAKNVEEVIEVSSLSTLIKTGNDGIILKNQHEINSFLDSNPLAYSYISEDRTIALIKLSLADGYDAKKLMNDLIALTGNIKEPAGLKVNLSGSAIESPILNEIIGPDMSKTTMYSLLGIVILLLITFRNIKHSILPMLTIALGVMCAIGFMGMIGMNLSTATSGVISMIMGIGIDFGIQIVMRFKYELKKHPVQISIQRALENVLGPMTITTIAALIGFKAMSLGELTMLGELGNVMSYGVVSCFLIAITLVPSLLVIFEKFNFKKIENIILRGEKI